MSLLVSTEYLHDRAAVPHTQLAPLAAGLTTELAPVYATELHIPREKVLLSREGGRCPRDGVLLEFDPFSPHRHRCPVCGETYTGTLHDRFWLYWYQLWLAERALHGALFAALGCDEVSGAFTAGEAGAFAAAVLTGYVDQYLLYPNSDNVLGPTRVFFSTYLESIWLLNLCIALDLLEQQDARYAELGARVRDRIVEPSAALIASYDEGASNRQVWNDAALIAANRLLGRPQDVEHAIFGRSGVVYHLQNGLLADGTWYEGENYHLFAHRGLLYSVIMAEQAGITLPHDLLDRFQEGFATPFLTALPDMTLPSRRDSQYAISLRQPRFAELCELGLARERGDGDARLRGLLHRLYGDDVPRADIGRSRSSADVERNLPGTSLSRADLGWRSLLFARPELPPMAAAPLGTVLLEAQGLAVFRRERERVYVALDYGTSGGGHGHPDRLNVLLSDGPTRWLDDMGTGSYVDPSLHWYRSTLAHNAPLFNGDEQQRVDGELLAFEECGDIGWVCARALDLYPGVAAMRTLVVAEDYVLDELAWEARSSTVMDLPIHFDPDTRSVRHFQRDEHTLNDTLGALSDVSRRSITPLVALPLFARDGARRLRGFLFASHPAVLYRATGPGAPGHARRPFLLLRVLSGTDTAWVRIVWSWTDEIDRVSFDDDAAIAVLRKDRSHDHLSPTVGGYRVERVTGAERRVIDLGGLVGEPAARAEAAQLDAEQPVELLSLGQPVVFELGREEYRRSEQSWDEAGRPTARVTLVPRPNELIVEVLVRKEGELTFVPATAVNPYDNESPDINGDGLQLYLVDDTGATAWVIVPEPQNGEGIVRARLVESWQVPRALHATWQRTADGYSMRVRIGWPMADGASREFGFGIVVNEKPLGRDRRRGQLVLGGASGQFVYLRGDREDRERLPRFRVVD
jgi:hypothetical protein